MADQAGGTGEAHDATTSNDKSYADALRKQEGETKKARIEAAERAVEKAKAALESAKDALATAKKENA